MKLCVLWCFCVFGLNPHVTCSSILPLQYSLLPTGRSRHSHECNNPRRENSAWLTYAVVILRCLKTDRDVVTLNFDPRFQDSL